MLSCFGGFPLTTVIKSCSETVCLLSARWCRALISAAQCRDSLYMLGSIWFGFVWHWFCMLLHHMKQLLIPVLNVIPGTTLGAVGRFML